MIFLGTTCLPSQGRKRFFAFKKKNITLDPRQKDRLQETGHIFVNT